MNQIADHTWQVLNTTNNKLLVGGEDTAHGSLPRLVSPPTGDNLGCTVLNITNNKIAESVSLPNEKETNILFNFFRRADRDVLFITILHKRLF